MTRPPSRLGHQPALDGVRGVGMLLVVAFHTWSVAAPGGLVGLDGFFVLSGFLITTLLLEERAATGRISLARFYSRRALRLGPALIVVLSACILYCVLDPGAPLAGQTLRAVPYTLGYVANWAYAYGTNLGLIAHTWSLSVEEQFYLVWAVLLVAILKWRGPRTALAFCAVGICAVWITRALYVAHGATWLEVYGSFDTRADSLLAGAALALTRQMGWWERVPSWLVANLGAAGMVVLAAVVHNMNVYPWLLRGGFCIVTVACSFVIAALVCRPWRPLVALFAFRPFVSIGRVSYGVYLWHFPLILVFYPLVPSRNALCLLVILVSSYCLAMISYTFIETPFLRLKRRLSAPPARVPVRPAPAPVHAGAVIESAA